jgi:predicted branched-subunit amino acid permease
VLQTLPFLSWLAAILSAVLLVVLWNFGESRKRILVVLTGWFAVAVYCQFLGGSPIVGAVGLLMQTILAIYLVGRSRLGG